MNASFPREKSPAVAAPDEHSIPPQKFAESAVPDTHIHPAGEFAGSATPDSTITQNGSELTARMPTPAPTSPAPARPQIPRVLSIAGTDPTGGAGIQADLKSIAAAGGYGMAAVTALVAQNTHGVRTIHTPPAQFLREQLDAVSDDVTIDAVKIGMLGTPAVIREVTAWIDRAHPPIVVLDPVMVATSGHRLIDDDAITALRSLISRADLITPNIPELAILAGLPEATRWADVLEQAAQVSRAHNVVVLAKGGHLEGADVPDALVDATEGTNSPAPLVTEFHATRVNTANTHGTGCSLSSAIATHQARLGSWTDAVAESKAWLTESLRHADDLHVGTGHGPISHFAGLWERGGLDTRPTPDAVAGEWWNQIAPVRDAIDALPFIRGLADGTLQRDPFLWYLAQDAIYLREYGRVLAEASRLAPTLEEQAFWALSAHGSVAAEILLHEGWLSEAAEIGGLPDDYARPSATTTAYLNHLRAAGSSANYGVIIAALLPCFWLYQDVGERLHAFSHDQHPYRSWLDTYADEEFAESTRQAIGFVTRAAASAPTATREAMRVAFWESLVHEREFFAAPLREREVMAR